MRLAHGTVSTKAAKEHVSSSQSVWHHTRNTCVDNTPQALQKTASTTLLMGVGESPGLPDGMLNWTRK